MARQQQIPGTETPADDELERVADEYHLACSTRRDASDTEKTKRLILLDAVEQRIKEGKLAKPQGDETCVYTYTDEDGRKRRVHYVGGKAIVKVNTAKKVEQPDDGSTDEPTH